ncbi:MAG: hypothetical protein ACTSQ9_00240 [Candidatus Hodarchaeales archaeon]
MTEPDPKYFKAALETLDLIKRLLEHHTKTQTMDKFSGSLSQIDAKADIECKADISANLSRSLGIDLPGMNTDSKPSTYWQGVRDMARIVHKHWIQGDQDPSTFQSILVKMEETLRNKTPDDETNPLKDFLDQGDKDPSAPTPFIYNPPPPPAGKAVAEQKSEISLEITDSPDEHIPREEMTKGDSKSLAKLILEKDEDEDAMLSKSLKDALNILRDED